MFLGKARRSLLEIQMEEQARREEEAFMKWWVEEEERVKREAEATAEALKVSTRKTKKGGGRGREGCRWASQERWSRPFQSMIDI